jgi:hypothetical protein
MRTRNTETMSLGAWIGLGIAVVVLAGAVGLTVFGGRVMPVQHPVEQIVPNDRLPN